MSYPYIISRDNSYNQVSLNEAKRWLRMDGVDIEDDVIQDAILSAQQWVETSLNRCLTPANFEWLTDYFPCHIADSYLITGLTSIEYISQGATEYTTLANTEYRFIRTGELLHKIEYPNTLPTLENRGDAVRVRFDAGYIDLPADLKLAIRAVLVESFDNRGDYVSEKKTLSDKLLNRYRIPYPS